MNDLEKFDASIDDLDSDRYENLIEKSHAEVIKMLADIKSGKGLGNILTGVSAVDNTIQGICPGMMDVYAAVAGCGKTSLIEMMTLRFLSLNHPVLLFQRDMTPVLFYFRLGCRMAGVSVTDVRLYGCRDKELVEKVERSCEVLRQTPVALYSPHGCSGEDVLKIVSKESKTKGVKLVVVDHIRTLRHTKANSWDGIEENSGYIRQSTNETGIPHVVLAHINREGAESARPTLSHIKGGDQLKDDSDNCCVMWAPNGRPEKTDPNQTWEVSFGFDKTRWDCGGTETMTYNGPKMTFERSKLLRG